MTQFARRIVQAAAFQRFIVAVILLAGLETSPALVRQHGAVLRALDALVLAIFVVEIALKLAAHGRRPWHYFRDGWNVFDFVIVALCALPLDSQFAAVLRLARVLRVLRLVTAVPKLQLLVGALLKSLGAMGYVALLLGLLCYIYAVTGVHLFGGHDPAHFGSLGSALLSLLRVITLDNWTEIYRTAQGTMPALAVLYFVSFILLGTMIMLNLFIGVVMNSMSEMHAEMEARERARHLRESGCTTLADEIHVFERQIEELKNQALRLRHRLREQAPPPRSPCDAGVGREAELRHATHESDR